MFLRIQDYWSYIQEDDLNVILSDANGSPDTKFLNQSENSAVALVKSYLSPRYDVTKIFPKLKIWSNTTSYTINDWIAYPTIEDTIYTALLDNIGKQPDTNTTEWVAEDGRDDLIMSLVIDITLYNIHSRINPRNVPEIRLQRRDEAIKWLGMVMQGDVQADLPKLEDDTSGDRIQFGSEIKRENNF